MHIYSAQVFRGVPFCSVQNSAVNQSDTHRGCSSVTCTFYGFVKLLFPFFKERVVLKHLKVITDIAFLSRENLWPQSCWTLKCWTDWISPVDVWLQNERMKSSSVWDDVKRFPWAETKQAVDQRRLWLQNQRKGSNCVWIWSLFVDLNIHH